MVCKGFNSDGLCGHFKEKKQMCPVISSVRDMFGDINACMPVATSLKIPHREE